MFSERRVTLQDVAKAAGLSKSGVSMALRNHPRISRATCTRVQTLARKLGYRPDPALSALSSYRSRNIPRRSEVIAWLNPHALPGQDRPHHSFQEYFQGASERAFEMGFDLQEFCFGEVGMTPDRMDRILTARGIRGLIICDSPSVGFSFGLDWSRYSIIQISPAYRAERFHAVGASYFRSMLRVLQEVEKEGAKRIGCLLNEWVEPRTEYAWRSAFLLFQSLHEKSEKIPILSMKPNNMDAMDKWLRKWKPDKIVTTFGEALLQPMLAHLDRSGRKITDGLGFVIASCVGNNASLAGIREKSHQIGRIAVTQLASMIAHNEKGIPDDPYLLTVEGTWVAGSFPQAVNWLSKRNLGRKEVTE